MMPARKDWNNLRCFKTGGLIHLFWLIRDCYDTFGGYLSLVCLTSPTNIPFRLSYYSTPVRRNYILDDFRKSWSRNIWRDNPICFGFCKNFYHNFHEVIGSGTELSPLPNVELGTLKKIIVRTLGSLLYNSCHRVMSLACVWVNWLTGLTDGGSHFRMRITLGVVLIRSLVFHVCVPECSRNGFGMRPYLLVQEKFV